MSQWIPRRSSRKDLEDTSAGAPEHDPRVNELLSRLSYQLGAFVRDSSEHEMMAYANQELALEKLEQVNEKLDVLMEKMDNIERKIEGQ